MQAEILIDRAALRAKATETRIGVLPIGYAEGLSRTLSNQGSVVIDGAAQVSVDAIARG